MTQTRRAETHEDFQRPRVTGMFRRARAKTSEAPVVSVDSKFDELNRRAEGGDRHAQFELGLHYARGKEGKDEYVEPDYAEASKWWRLAADQGDKRAITNLGFLYASLLLESASGDECATSNVGIFYALGLRGGAANEAEAIECWRRAAALDHPAAQFELAMWHWNRSFIAKEDDSSSGTVRLSQGRSPEEYRNAFDWFRAAAENGHAEAQLWLGQAFSEGLDMPKGPIEAIGWLHENQTDAIKWLRAAARQKESAALHLAEIYARAEGAEFNAAESIRWLLVTAQADFPGADQAQQALGYLYASGDLLPINFDEAAKWWRLAVARGRLQQERYCPTIWRERSASEALSWLCQHAANGSETARKLLEFFPSILRKLISKDEEMEIWRKSVSKYERIEDHATVSRTSAQKATVSIEAKVLGYIISSRYGGLAHTIIYHLIDDEAALHFLQERDKEGDLDATLALGLLGYYRTHMGFDEKHDAEAAKWLLKAAEKGMTPAFSVIAEMNEHGLGMLADETAAERWYRWAAEHGDANAQYQLANLYLKKNDYKINPEAMHLYEGAAKKGHALAQYRLAEEYERAEKLEKRWSRRNAEAFKWYRRAATQGYATAQHALGSIYQREEFPLHDDQEAVEWFLKAARQHNQSAQRALSWAYFRGRGVPPDGAEAAKWDRLANENRYPY